MDLNILDRDLFCIWIIYGPVWKFEKYIPFEILKKNNNKQILNKDAR